MPDRIQSMAISLIQNKADMFVNFLILMKLYIFIYYILYVILFLLIILQYLLFYSKILNFQNILRHIFSFIILHHHLFLLFFRPSTLQNYMSHIYVFRTHNHSSLLSTLNILQSFINNHPNVKLIVVDSVSSCLRHSFTNDGAKRVEFIHSIGTVLTKLARENMLAVCN